MARWFTVLSFLLSVSAACAEEGEVWRDPFRMEGASSIMAEEHLGIINGQLTAGIAYGSVATVDGLWAPPYVSSDFRLTMNLYGEAVPTAHYTWSPIEVTRGGRIRGIGVNTATVLTSARGGILEVTLENGTAQAEEVPVAFAVTGTLDKTDTWEFSRAQSSSEAPASAEGNRLIKEQGACAIALCCGAPDPEWDSAGSQWKCSVAVAPGASTNIYVTFTIGEKADAAARCEALAANPEQALAEARAAYRARVEDLFTKLPKLESKNEALVRFYNRSLVHFVTNRWEVPEFKLHPYYSTGSIRGGCVCDYLWNFGEIWEILPLYDPAADREHIKQFLKTDLTKHFAFMPITGDAFGPWYPVNQEKIIGLIYYYVKNTGDTAFLEESVDGKTILEWAVFHALAGDDPAKPVALIDYGPSNSHLELRRGYPYNHVMPDLNGRRYANYKMAAQLCSFAGQPAPYLAERAYALKKLLKERLWNPEGKWFWFENDAGTKDIRYTVQLFKLFGSGVLDAEETAGLLGHLNETEFLSAQGLHSMSKTDIAYDQVDIDNGGGGICTSFTPQIAERLYKCGHAAAAEELLKRTLWWGARLPYWGDSIVANGIDYRRDTPLQCTVDGVAVAQCVLFGMFGVMAEFDGGILIDPHPPAFAPHSALKGLVVRGVTLDIALEGDAFEVTCGGAALRSKPGAPILVRKEDHGLELWSGVLPVTAGI